MTQDSKHGLPNKDQLLVMMKRYASVKFTPVDNNQEPMTIRSDASDFKKPIFFDTDCGRTFNKIKMALKQQGFFPNDDSTAPSRVVLEGDNNLVNLTCSYHHKLLGDDCYNPLQPYENPLLLMRGVNINDDLLIDVAKQDDLT